MVFHAYSCLLCNLKSLWNIIMILHSEVEQIMTMCRVQEWQPLLTYFLSNFPLMVSDASSCPLHNLITLWYIIIILYSYVEEVLTMCRLRETATPAFILSGLFPLDCFRCNFVSARLFESPLDFLMILHNYVEYVFMMCRVQD